MINIVKTHHWQIVLVLVIMLWASGLYMVKLDAATASDNDDQTLGLIKAGTRIAFSQIKSGKGTVTTYLWTKEMESGEEMETQSVYDIIFSLPLLKMKSHIEYGKVVTTSGKIVMGKGDADTISSYDGGRAVTLIADKKKATIGDAKSLICSRMMKRFNVDVSMLYHGLVALEGPDDPALRQSSYPRTFNELQLLRWEDVNGDRCAVVERSYSTTNPSGTYKGFARFWVCPDKGYAMRRYQDWGQLPGHNDEIRLLAETNVDLREYATGVWGPVFVDLVQYDFTKGGEYTKSLRQTIKYADDFQLNVPVTQSDFTVTIPSGTEVYDELTDASYTKP